MGNLLHDIALARQARRIVAAQHPGQFPPTAAGALDQTLTTVEAALSTAFTDPSHSTAQAVAAVVLRHRDKLEALLAQAAAVAGTA